MKSYPVPPALVTSFLFTDDQYLLVSDDPSREALWLWTGKHKLPLFSCSLSYIHWHTTHTFFSLFFLFTVYLKCSMLIHHVSLFPPFLAAYNLSRCTWTFWTVCCSWISRLLSTQMTPWIILLMDTFMCVA